MLEMCRGIIVLVVTDDQFNKKKRQLCRDANLSNIIPYN